MKPHTAGIAAMGLSILGWLSSPAVLDLIPSKYSWIVMGAGIVAQGLTKGVQHGGTDLVPKDSPEAK